LSALPHAIAGSLLLAAATAWGLADKPTGIAFPSGDTVPENLLRIELRFSAPLRNPFSIENLKLIGADGRVIEHAFLDLPLPSADGTRVTVLLEPGRVKSGLVENRDLGRALRAGSAVTLEVDDPQLVRPVIKRWRVTDVNAEPIRPDRWRLQLPRLSTTDPLEVRFGSPLSSTAENLIAIRGPDAKRVPGAAHLVEGETAWRFVPASPWRPGFYGVVARAELEDPAGNRLCGAFEAMAASHIRCNDIPVQSFQLRERPGP